MFALYHKWTVNRKLSRRNSLTFAIFSLYVRIRNVKTPIQPTTNKQIKSNQIVSFIVRSIDNVFWRLKNQLKQNESKKETEIRTNLGTQIRITKKTTQWRDGRWWQVWNLYSSVASSMWSFLTWVNSVLISRSIFVKRSSPRPFESCFASVTMSSWLMYMPRGNLDLCRSTPLLVLLWRERLLKPGPDVGRNVPVRLNVRRCFFWANECIFWGMSGQSKRMRGLMNMWVCVCRMNVKEKQRNKLN